MPHPHSTTVRRLAHVVARLGRHLIGLAALGMATASTGGTWPFG